MQFTKEQLIKRLEEQDSAARYALSFVQDSEILRDIEMDLRITEIALASLDVGSNSNPAPGPLSNYRLRRISDILSKAAAQRDGGNIGYAMSDAVKVIDEVLESIAREQVRREHAAWSQATFGDVGPVGPLKHLSKEALEAAAEPGDLSEWADMQFLLWDAQRRAGICDGEITAAMEEKLKVNMARQWPEPKDGEPRFHIKKAPQQEG